MSYNFVMTDRYFDVVGINLATKQVRLMDTHKTLKNANAIMEMAVIRRGVEGEFFAVVPEGLYAEGDLWKGGAV